MGERLTLGHYQQKWPPIPVGVSNIVSTLVWIVQRILRVQKWLDRLTSKHNPILIQEIVWIKNPALLKIELSKHDNNEAAYLRSILESKIPKIWEDIYNILEKKLTPTQIGDLNKFLDLNIDIYEMWLSHESKRIIVTAFDKKIGNQPSFVGPIKTIYD